MSGTPARADPSGARDRAEVLGALAAHPRCSRAAARAAAIQLGLSERQVHVLVRQLRQAQAPHSTPQAHRPTGGRGKTLLPPACGLVGRPGRWIVPADTDLRLLGSLYDAVGEPDGWGRFLHDLAETYPGGHGALVVHDQALHNGLMQVGSHWEPHVYRDYNRYYVTKNPWIPHLVKRPIGQAMFPDAFVPRAELAATEFYNDLLRPVRIDTAIGVTLQRDGSRFMDVSVLLPAANADRDPDAVGRLQRLAPHLLRVAQLKRQLAGLELRATAAEAALERLHTAVLVVNTAGRVEHMNAPAERMVAAGDGLTMVQGVLRTAHHAENQALQQLVQQALQAPRNIAAKPGGTMRISRRSGAAAYEALVAPVSEKTLMAKAEGTMAVVFVRDPAARSRTSLESLRGLYGLTGAEARLMQALLAGDTLELIADRFAVSKETLRSQLKSVFLKTGAASQTQLVRTAMSGVSGLTAERG